MNDPDRSGQANPESATLPRSFVSPYEANQASATRGGNDEPKVGEIMTTDVRSCRADRTLVCAGSAMHRGDCRFLPVVDAAGRPIAVITDGDISEIGTTDPRPLRNIPVSEAMSREVFTCRPEDGLREVLDTMKNRRIRHLPVIDADGRLVGVVSLTDVILRVVEDERDAVKSLRPVIAEVLRVVSQKYPQGRTVRFNPFRED